MKSHSDGITSLDRGPQGSLSSRVNGVPVAQVNWARMRGLKDVPRWSIIHTHAEQSVAEHTYQVMVIGLWLWKQIWPSSQRFEFMPAALVHDYEEAWTGDEPASAKTSPKKCTEAPEAVVKLADKLEAYLFAQEEMMSGNKLFPDRVHSDAAARVRRAYGDLHHCLHRPGARYEAGWLPAWPWRSADDLMEYACVAFIEGWSCPAPRRVVD